MVYATAGSMIGNSGSRIESSKMDDCTCIFMIAVGSDVDPTRQTVAGQGDDKCRVSICLHLSWQANHIRLW